MRYPDWPKRMRDEILRQRNEPFVWGKRDCCLAAGDIAAAIGDLDVVAPFRGLDYVDSSGALLAMRKYLGQTLEPSTLLRAVCMKRAEELKLVSTPVLLAQRGDLVLARAITSEGEQDVLSAVDLSGQYLITAFHDTGWVQLSLSAGKLAWKV